MKSGMSTLGSVVCGSNALTGRPPFPRVGDRGQSCISPDDPPDAR